MLALDLNESHVLLWFLYTEKLALARMVSAVRVGTGGSAKEFSEHFIARYWILLPPIYLADCSLPFHSITTSFAWMAE